MDSSNTIEVAGHAIAVTHLDKVLYPEAGTRKFDVIEYYLQVADAMVPHLAGRPVTRKRWPDGVTATPFFEKNLPTSAPEWIERRGLEHSERELHYPVVGSAADLVWLGQQAALELHVPQWRFPADTDPSEPISRAQRRSDRLVIDLDPGPGVALAECAQIALLIHQTFDEIGVLNFPVTSGSKGIHVYGRLPDPVSPDNARTLARQLAEQLAAAMPDRVTASMARSARDKRVFIDWSQNSGSKTTLSPYSLRGLSHPWVAAPRTWDELSDSDIRQLTYAEVLDRLRTDGDLLAELDQPASGGAAPTSRPRVVDLGEYRSKRTRGRTPEPFGDSNPVRDNTFRPIFVIQEHHARRLHFDFRLEHDGVLVSWAVPKNLPDDPSQNRLAVQTEDHPLDYADFDGTIPSGEYGGGTVSIFDRGTYEVEKWRADEIIVRLHGNRIQGRYALIKTGGKNWLAHLMADDPAPIAPSVMKDPRPMLATDEPIEKLGDDWAYEGKWDGYRVLLRWINGDLRLTSRSGTDMTADFPELEIATARMGLMDVVLDGEVVAVDAHGQTNFGLLAGRAHAQEQFTLKYYLFDVLYLNGTSLVGKPWHRRRDILTELAPLFAGTCIEVPPLLDGPGAAAAAESVARGWEGVVAKRRDSVYQQGRRTTHWLKHKNWNDIEVVIGGWRPGKGTRSHLIGSLILGLPEETGLRYVGRVGTGFTAKELAALAQELEPLRRTRSPFVDTLDRAVEQDATWVLPTLVCDVRFMDWSSRGHLRHPSWRGIRRDKLPGDL